MQIQGYLLSTTCLCVPDGDCALLEPLVLHCDCYLCEMQGLWFTMQLRVGCSKVMGEILSCWKQPLSGVLSLSPPCLPVWLLKYP